MPRQQNQYNSSNTPPWMNNHLVPMDVGQNRALIYWGQARERVMNLPHILRTKCYNCGREGHIVGNCSRKAPTKPCRLGAEQRPTRMK
jgi:hypothetical protein